MTDDPIEEEVAPTTEDAEPIGEDEAARDDVVIDDEPVDDDADAPVAEDNVDATEPVGEDESVDDDELEATEDDDGWPADHAYYTIEKWKGLPNYCCRYCKFKTLDGKDKASDGLPVMVSHFVSFHTQQPGATKTHKSGLVGADGKPL